MGRPIVVGYDGSDCAEAALDEALRLAQGLDATVVAVFGYGIPAGGGETADLAAAVHRLGEERLALAQEHHPGVVIEKELVASRPADALLQVAEARDAQLIVVGTRGEHAMKALIVGSTPYRLLPQATIPVVVVPTP